MAAASSTDHYPHARKACWDFHGIYTSSRHVPGVRFPASMHPGLIGMPAVGGAARDAANEREAKLIADRPGPGAAACHHAGRGGGPTTALMGQMKGAARDAAAKAAWRTVRRREHGGNCDIKNLSRGSQVFFPVYVKGGGLSMGDIHWSQGDGEITFCGAIEMAGLDRHRRRPHQGRRGEVRHHQPDLQDQARSSRTTRST